MDPIFVPAPPHSAYNPNRRVSDLLLSQVKHFQHVEHKRGDLGIDPQIARNVYTEGGAARYIAASPAHFAEASRVVQLPQARRGAISQARKEISNARSSPRRIRSRRHLSNKGRPDAKAAKKLTPERTTKKSAKKKP